MSIITRHICRRVLLHYFTLMVVLLAFFIFVDFMENIDRLTKHHAPLQLLALYYACMTPRVVVEISWISFLVAILFVLGGLVKNNELAALLSGGISIYSVIAPILAISALLYGVVFSIQEFLIPETMLTAHELTESDFSGKPKNSTLYDIAGVGRRNVFYFFDVADIERGILFNVHVHKMQDGHLVERIDAETATWNGSSGSWTLQDGAVKRFGPDGTALETTAFPEMKAPFKESPKALKIYASEGAELSALQLGHQIRNLEKSGYDARRLKVQYHARFALPAANIVVVFLALSFALECRRGGLTIGFILSLMTALLYYGTFQIGMILGKGGSLAPALSAWLANVLFFAIGAGLIARART